MAVQFKGKQSTTRASDVNIREAGKTAGHK
jgi:hypothetical protein